MIARLTLAVALGVLLVAPPAFAQTAPPDTAGITAALGRPGTVMPGGVYRVGLPRADLAVTLDGVSLRADVQRMLGRTGNTAGGVLSISVPRAEKVTIRGMPLTPGMGVTNAMNFQDAGSGRIATTGNYVLIASEVDPTVAALRSHGFAVTAMHQHMIGDDPTLYYVHFWRIGSPAEVAGGLRDALSHVHTAS